MRFALLGNHPDGLAFAAALVATGRHTLAAVYDAPVPDFAPQAQLFSDAMEILADPVIELVIIAGALAVRDEQLRRAVQSERAVACVHPSGEKPDIAYEAALIQGDTKKPLLPLLTEALHPAVARLSDLLAADAPFRLLLVERWITAAGEADSLNPSWPVLRRLGGEIVEVSALAPTEEIEPGEPLLVSGRFEKGGMFQATLLPGAAAERRRIYIHGSCSGFELLGPNSDGSATLRWQDIDGKWQQQTWGPTDRWRPLVEALESNAATPSWQDEVRALEWRTTRCGEVSRSAAPAGWSIRKSARKSAAKAR